MSEQLTIRQAVGAHGSRRSSHPDTALPAKPTASNRGPAMLSTHIYAYPQAYQHLVSARLTALTRKRSAARLPPSLCAAPTQVALTG